MRLLHHVTSIFRYVCGKLHAMHMFSFPTYRFFFLLKEGQSWKAELSLLKAKDHMNSYDSVARCPTYAVIAVAFGKVV